MKQARNRVDLKERRPGGKMGVLGKCCQTLGIQSLLLNPSGPKIEEMILNPKASSTKDRISSNLDQVYALGNERFSGSITEAANILMERDYPQIHHLTNDNYEPGQIGLVAVPKFFRSKKPEVVDHDEYGNVKRRKGDCDLYHMKENKLDVIKQVVIDGAMKGEMPEKEVHQVLVDYFEGKKEDVLLLHGHKFSEIDMQKVKDCSHQEKDFVIVNLSHGYIMSIEVKHAEKKGNKSSVEQVKKTKGLLERWFGADISSEWKFVGVSYVERRLCSTKCKNCQPFLLSSNDSKSSSLAQTFEAMLNHVSTQLEGRPKPKPEEFRKLVKYLIFYSSSVPAPVVSTNVSHVEKHLEAASLTSNIQFWMFLTPDQRKVMDEERVIFTSSWSTGKTLLMKRKAEELAEKGEKVLFLVGRIRNSIPLLWIELAKHFSKKDNVTVRHFECHHASSLSNIVDEYKDHHIFVDELVIKGSLSHLNRFTDRIPDGKVLWITIAGYDFMDNSETLRESLPNSFPSFRFPAMRIPLRNAKSITEKVLHEANGLKIDRPYPSTHLPKWRGFDNLPESEKVKEIDCGQAGWKAALQKALGVMRNSKALIIVEAEFGYLDTYDVSDFVEECEKKRPLEFNGKENEITKELEAWMISPAGHRKQHLVVDYFVVNGYESQNVILLTKRGGSGAELNLMMRAMAHVIVINIKG